MTRIRILALSLLLAGCNAGPDFTPPAPPAADTAYRSAQDGMPAPAGVATGAQVPLRWWTAFGSADLDRLVDQAIANNQSLAASNATLARSLAQVDAVAGRRLPQVDANARVERQQANLAAFGFDSSLIPGGGGNPTFNLYSVGGGISYDLDLFGANRRRLEQARAQAQAQLHQTQAAHLALAGRVVNQVLAIAALRARMAAVQTLLAEDRRLIDLTQKRRKAGSGTLTEVLNVEAQLAADRDSVPQLARQLDEARHMLATLLGLAPSALGATDFDLADFVLPTQVPLALPSQLVRTRPDIAQAEADLHAATAAIGVATAALYPDVTIGATLSYGAQKPGNLFESAFRGFDIFAGLSAPIFHGGTLKAQKRAAVAEAEASAATYRQTVLTAFQQVADLLGAIESDRQSLANQQGALDISARSRDLSRRSFQVGNSGLLTVLDAERLYQRARLGLVDAQARQYLNVARLYVATAGGWTGPAV